MSLQDRGLDRGGITAALVYEGDGISEISYLNLTSAQKL